MQETLNLCLVRVVQYNDHMVFYGITGTGDIPPGLHGHPDENRDESLIAIFPVSDSDRGNLEEYAKQRGGWKQINVYDVSDFCISPQLSSLRCFSNPDPTEITTTPKRKSLLRNESRPVDKTSIHKNIRLPVELFKQLEAFAEQNRLHVSGVIVTALQEYVGRLWR